MSGQLILALQEASVALSGKPIFEELTLNIHEGSRIALVGRNGAGKTTLMRMITGEKELDEGERWTFQGLSVGYMQQDVVPKDGQSVFDFTFGGLNKESKDEQQDYKVDMILTPLGLDPHAMMTALSGGQLRRACLARALVEEPDLLLLDEPTNHLDLEGIEWLEGFLQGYSGTMLCVSHDKTFLSNITDRIFWIDRGAVRVCSRGFKYFDEWSTDLLEQEERELKNRAKLVAQEVEWASRGVKARRKRNVRRLELMKEARDKLKADQSSFRKIMARLDVPEIETDTTSKICAEFYNVHKKFEEKTILESFNLRITRGDRIGILGKNGSGKTTFLKLLVGELTPDQGRVKRQKNVRVSYFDQKRADLNPEDTLKKTLCPNGGDYINVLGKQRHVCGYLKDFLFDPARVDDKVAHLSGGQKNRLMLAKVLADPGEFLILDEPTNDLDMDTLDMLEEILVNYTGTLFVVSHDRDFLDQVVTKTLAFEGEGKVEGYIGGYSDYMEARKAEAQKAEKKEKASQKPNKAEVKSETQPVAKPQPTKKLSYKLQYELDNLPEQISGFEEEIETLNKKLADADFYNKDPEGFMNATKDLDTAKRRLERAETRWLELEEMKA
ncbi:MAG: ATP-binding cassette domain-containing protein [Alphaproteobacteria bacterium]|nr:ATP-binding cassette domain-containing protein [Alphaproteobacteria bacterium]